MEPNSFKLEGPSLAELGARVLREHGPDARIVSAERVTVGGLGGFLARRHYEVLVEVRGALGRPAVTGGSEGNDGGGGGGTAPLRRRGRRAAPAEAPPAAEEVPAAATASVDDRTTGIPASKPIPPGTATPRDGQPAAGGVSALLAAAEEAEARLQGNAPAVSTESPDFARLMDELTFTARPPAGARAALPVDLLQGPDPAGAADGSVRLPTDSPSGSPANSPGAAARSSRPGRNGTVPGDLLAGVPAPRTGPGDLVVVAGLGTQAAEGAHFLAGTMEPDPALIPAVGAAPAGRADLLRARAQGVADRRTVLAVLTLDPGTPVERQAEAEVVRAADQLWVVVDARHKHEDSAAWVRALGSVRAVDAVLRLGAAETSTPETVLRLGPPVFDAQPTASGRPPALG